MFKLLIIKTVTPKKFVENLSIYQNYGKFKNLHQIDDKSRLFLNFLSEELKIFKKQVHIIRILPYHKDINCKIIMHDCIFILVEGLYFFVRLKQKLVFIVIIVLEELLGLLQIFISRVMETAQNILKTVIVILVAGTVVSNVTYISGLASAVAVFGSRTWIEIMFI